MALLSAMYRNGLWISVPLFLISAVLLGLFIRNVIRLVRQAHLVSVALLERQHIDFAAAGRVVLCMEGPRFTGRFANLDYELSADDGARVEGRTTWFHARTSGVSTARMELKSFHIPQPGRYLLRVQGLEAGWTAEPEHRIVFMRPHLARSILSVIGILLAAGALIGSLVLFILRLTSPGEGA